MTINICIPVLNNYKGLKNLIESAEKGIVVPDFYYVLDNGGKLYTADIWPDFEIYIDKMVVDNPKHNLGVAASWNWFIKHTPQYRIISNDDIIFLPETLEDFFANLLEDNFCFPSGNGAFNAFSFFYLPDAVIDKVGLFDEEISPNYGYFEDNDYTHRMSKVGERIHMIGTNIVHIGSETLNKLSPTDIEAHHQKFRMARFNYVKKWGGLPGNEIL